MIIATLAVCSLLSPPSFDAADYFPLTPGTKWLYQETSRNSTGAYTDIVAEPVEIAGSIAFPIETRKADKLIDTTYYRLIDNGIFIVADQLKKPLELPRPVFKNGTLTQKWDHQSMIDFMGGPVPLFVKGTATVKGKRNVLGKDVECLEVVLDARVGPEGGTPIISRQTSIYAKGIGLAEMQEKTTVARKTEERKLKLLEFTPART